MHPRNPIQKQEAKRCETGEAKNGIQVHLSLYLLMFYEFCPGVKICKNMQTGGMREAGWGVWGVQVLGLVLRLRLTRPSHVQTWAADLFNRSAHSAGPGLEERRF